MDNRTARRATIILSVIMIVAIGSSAILQLFTRQTADATPEPTTAPTATLPAPVEDLNTIRFDQDYLHPSGMFSVAQPTGWNPGQQTTKPDGVEITMNNANLLSVLQVSLQIAQKPLASMDELDAIYTTAALNQSWSNYRNPRETSRQRLSDNKLQIDFELQNARQQTFLARQVSWWDTDWIYSIRVVTPENQIDLLKYMMDKLVASFKPNRIFAGTPADWSAYYDPTNKFVIRFPSSWKVTDSAPGRPASVAGEQSQLRLEALPGVTVADAAAATAWVQANQPGATVLSANPITRGESSGFGVSYTYTDVDGNSNSGFALLLNSSNSLLTVANLRIFEANVDLNTDTSQVSHDTLVKVMNSLQLLPGLNVPLPTPTPTPTPLPPTATPEATTEVTTEATAEATSEATTEVTAEATTEAAVEATAEATTEATTEATAEATSEATIEVTTEVTPEATVEMTAEATTEATPEATASS